MEVKFAHHFGSAIPLRLGLRRTKSHYNTYRAPITGKCNEHNGKTVLLYSTKCYGAAAPSECRGGFGNSALVRSPIILQVFSKGSFSNIFLGGTTYVPKHLWSSSFPWCGAFYLDGRSRQWFINRGTSSFMCTTIFITCNGIGQMKEPCSAAPTKSTQGTQLQTHKMRRPSLRCSLTSVPSWLECKRHKFLRTWQCTLLQVSPPHGQSCCCPFSVLLLGALDKVAARRQLGLQGADFA